MINESERQLEYHESAFDGLVRKLREIPTKVKRRLRVTTSGQFAD